MADRSTQHGRRLDEAMEAEVEGLVRGAPVETRAREDLEPEPVEHESARLPDPEAEEQHREVLERSDLARFVRPSAFPADVDTLLAVATEERAPDEILAELAALPSGVEFLTVGDVWAALGHDVEHREAPAPPAPAPPPAPVRVPSTHASEPGRPPVPEVEVSAPERVVGLVVDAAELLVRVLTAIPRRLLRR